MPSPSATPESVRARLGELLATRSGRLLRGALVGAVAVLGCSVVLRQARATVHRMPAYRLGPTSVAFVDLPGIVDPTMKAHLVQGLPELWPTRPEAWPTTYDVGLERRLREVLGTHPMIRTVRDVEVRFPSEVRVRADLRTPLAQFRARFATSRGGLAVLQVPVDVEGVVLHPDTYAPFLAESYAVVVTGVEAVCPGLGRRWTDTKEQVAEGLAAARVSNRLNAELGVYGVPKVVAVDVSGFPATPKTRHRGEVVLRLSDGRFVQWGRTERNLGDVTHEDGYEVKRDRLRDLVEARGRDDRSVLDVRYPIRAPVAPRDL